MKECEDPKRFLRLNAIIMDTAIRGKCDCDYGWIALHWIIVRSFVFAYIENVNTDTCFFRIFRCPDISAFQKNDLVFLNPENKLLECLYDSSEREGKREVLCCEDETDPWMTEALKAAALISDGVDRSVLLNDPSDME